jgi:hypothetical protein
MNNERIDQVQETLDLQLLTEMDGFGTNSPLKQNASFGGTS